MKKFIRAIGTFFSKLYSRKEVQHTDSYYRRIAFLNKYAVLFHAIASLVIVFLIEGMSRWSLITAFSFVKNHTLAYLYNSFLVFVSLSAAFMFRRRFFYRFIVCSFWVVLGVINGCVLAKRVTPFGFTDLSCISELLAMTGTGYIALWQIVMVIVGAILFLLACTLLFVKLPVYKGKIHKLMAPTMALLLIFVGVPASTTAAQAAEIVDSYYSNIAQGYQDNGFVYSFSSSVVDIGMSQPENYSEENIDQILEKTEALSEEDDSSNPNIICVLLESFCDPYEINYLELNEDPIPTFHSLEENYSTGYLTVPVVGAGTANSEFEVLSGMSLSFFGTGEYPYKTILKETDCESIASDLSSIGYATHAVHNNSGSFYHRINAFSQMGFDTFTSKELMNITEWNPLGTWANDSILASETIKTLDSTPDQSDFTYTITVGTHGTYPTELVEDNPEYLVTGCYNEDGTVDQATNNQWTYYVNQLHQCDEFISELISELSERDEDTIVVLWGDHLPTMGLTDEDMKSGDIYKTKYVTWNNMGLSKEDADLYAYQLMSSVTDSVGIHEGTITNYHQTSLASGEATEDRETYLDGLDNLQYDILYGKRYCYNGGDPYQATEVTMGVEEVSLKNVTSNYNDDVLARLKTALSPETDSTPDDSTETIDEDNSHLSDSTLTLASSNTGAETSSSVSGSTTDTADVVRSVAEKPLSVDSTEMNENPDDSKVEAQAENMVLLKGTNFTPWSKVYVNGNKVNTIYLSGTELAISAHDLHSGDKVSVNQLGSHSTVYRSSNVYTYFK